MSLTMCWIFAVAAYTISTRCAGLPLSHRIRRSSAFCWLTNLSGGVGAVEIGFHCLKPIGAATQNLLILSPCQLLRSIHTPDLGGRFRAILLTRQAESASSVTTRPHSAPSQGRLALWVQSLRDCDVLDQIVISIKTVSTPVRDSPSPFRL